MLINNEDMIYEDIFNNGIKFKIPVGFKDMDISISNLKYPLDNRPAIIKTNEKTTVDFKFNIFEPYVDCSLLEQLTNAVRMNLMKMNTAYVFNNKETFEREYGQLAWFDFSNPSLEGALYNIIYYMSTENTTIHGALNCSFNEKEDWIPYMMEHIKTIVASKEE